MEYTQAWSTTGEKAWPEKPDTEGACGGPAASNGHRSKWAEKQRDGSSKSNRDRVAEGPSAHHRRGCRPIADCDGDAAMISLPAGTRIWIAAGVTDLRRGFTGLSAQVQTAL